MNLDLKKLETFCNYHESNNKDGRVISNVGGYQTGDLPLDTPVIKPLIKEIEKNANEFAKWFINPNPQKIINTWFNINKYKDTNIAHTHTMSEISGVVYVKTPKDCGQIVFHHPMKDLLGFYDTHMNIASRNSYNSHLWKFTPTENTMYLFPSWLVHYVEANDNKKEERISFSFNTRQIGSIQW